MKLEHLMLKYKISPKDLDVISECMLLNFGIFQASETLLGKLSPDQIFVVAKALALEDHGCALEDIAPNMFLERISLNEGREESWKARADYSKEVKRLTGILEDISLLVLEREGIINVREINE